MFGDLDAVAWELGQIVGNPELSWYLRPKAERKTAQAKTPLVQETMRPFFQEQAVLSLLKTEAAFSCLQETIKRRLMHSKQPGPKREISHAPDERGGYCLSIGQRVQSDLARKIVHRLAYILL